MKEQPLFVLKPKLGPAIFRVISALIVSLIIAVAFIVVRRSLFAVGFLPLIILLVLFSRVMDLKATRYIFYADKMKFHEGFLNKIQRTVTYDKITDTILTQSVFDRIFDTGAFEFMTAGSVAGGAGFLSRAGIIMAYIPDPDHNFQKIQNLIQRKRK